MSWLHLENLLKFDACVPKDYLAFDLVIKLLDDRWRALMKENMEAPADFMRDLEIAELVIALDAIKDKRYLYLTGQNKPTP